MIRNRITLAGHCLLKSLTTKRFSERSKWRYTLLTLNPLLCQDFTTGNKHGIRWCFGCEIHKPCQRRCRVTMMVHLGFWISCSGLYLLIATYIGKDLFMAPAFSTVRVSTLSLGHLTVLLSSTHEFYIHLDGQVRSGSPQTAIRPLRTVGLASPIPWLWALEDWLMLILLCLGLLSGDRCSTEQSKIQTQIQIWAARLQTHVEPRSPSIFLAIRKRTGRHETQQRYTSCLSLLLHTSLSPSPSILQHLYISA